MTSAWASRISAWRSSTGPPGRGGPQILKGKTQLQTQVRVEGLQAIAGQSQPAIGGGRPGHGAGQAIQPERWPVAKDPGQAQVQALPGDLEPPTRQVRRQVQVKPRRLEPQGPLAGNLALERQALQAQPRLARRQARALDPIMALQGEQLLGHLEALGQEPRRRRPRVVAGVQGEIQHPGPVIELGRIALEIRRHPQPGAGGGGQARLQIKTVRGAPIVEVEADLRQDEGRGGGVPIQPLDLAIRQPQPALCEKGRQGPRLAGLPAPARPQPSDGELAITPVAPGATAALRG